METEVVRTMGPGYSGIVTQYELSFTYGDNDHEKKVRMIFLPEMQADDISKRLRAMADAMDRN